MSPQAQSPLQEWIASWTGFLDGTAPKVFLVVVLVVGTLIMVRKGNKKKGVPGGLKAAIGFGALSALVFLPLTNVEAVAGLLDQELPLVGR